MVDMYGRQVVCIPKLELDTWLDNAERAADGDDGQWMYELIEELRDMAERYGEE